jgi:hypothetical protein
MAYLYKLSSSTGSDMKECLIFIMAMIAICTPFLNFFSLWLDYHVGFVNLNEAAQSAIAGNYPGGALTLGINTFTGYWLGSPSAFWTYTLIGAVIAVILQFLRSTFTWFPIDPLYMMISLNMNAPMLGWLTLITGLILKVVLSKTFGPRRMFEYSIYLLVGLMVGMSLLFLVAGLDAFFRLAIPNLQSKWR